MIYELLCIDQRERVKFREITSFLDALAFNEEIWHAKPIKNEVEATISNDSLSIRIVPIDGTKVAADLFTSAFVVRAEGEFPTLEKVRVRLVVHLKNLGFAHIMVLTDDPTRQLAEQIYPLIHEIESRLRRYLVKFFTVKIGLEWFNISVPKEVRDKVRMRRDNERILIKPSLVSADVNLIDFNELGEIITRQTSVFSKVEDVIERITSAGSLEELRNEVTGNYPKYFRDIFQSRDFDSKWGTLFEIRNRVAHNNYVFADDLESTKQLTSALSAIIDQAEGSVDDAVLSKSELRAISKALVDVVETEADEALIDVGECAEEIRNSGQPRRRILAENNIIDELRLFNEMRPESWEFLALSKFLDHLEDRGYNRQVASSIISILDKQDLVEIFYVDNPHGYYKTAAIRLPE